MQSEWRAYIVSGQIFVVDFTQRHFVRRDEVCKFSQDNSISQAFLQLNTRWNLFTDTRLNPANKQPVRQTHTCTHTNKQMKTPKKSTN